MIAIGLAGGVYWMLSGRAPDPGSLFPEDPPCTLG